MTKMQVFTQSNPPKDDGEKFFLPSRTDPSGYEKLEDFIARSMSPDFLMEQARRAVSEDGYTAEDVETNSDKVFEEGFSPQDARDFDISDITESRYNVQKRGAIATRKKQGDGEPSLEGSADSDKNKKVEPAISPVPKAQGESGAISAEPEGTPAK